MLVPFQSTRGSDLGAVVVPPPDAPVAGFSAAPNEQLVAFSDLSSAVEGLASWLWEFGDGQFAFTQNPTHLYADPGTYQVALTVTTSTGRQAKATQEVTVPAIPVLSTAIAAMAGKTLVLPPGTYPLDASVTLSTTKIVLQHGAVITVPVSRTLASDIDFSQGGQIQPAAGVVVTLTGHVSIPPLHHAFDISLGGSVLGSSTTGYVCWLTHFGSYRSETNWYKALVAAQKMIESMVAAPLYFAAKATAYSVDGTGQPAIPWTNDGCKWLGMGRANTQIDVDTRDGTPFIVFTPPGLTIVEIVIDGLFIRGNNVRTAPSDVGNGLIFSHASRGMSKSRIGPDIEIQQQNPDFGIWECSVSGDGAFLENYFGGEWSYGTENDPALVPAIKITTEGSLFGPNEFDIHRVHCHFARAPFLDLLNTSVGNWGHGNVFKIWNVEKVRSGLLKIAGFRGTRFQGPTTFFDSADLDGDVYYLADGSGGLAGTVQVFDQIYPRVGDLLGVAETIIAVSSITRSGSTATVTTVVAHLYITGDKVEIFNTDQDDYKISAIIIVTGSATFTYTVANAPTTPATGATMKCRRVHRKSSSVTQAAGVATLTTGENHNLVTGDVVHNLGWDQAAYNGRKLITAVTSNTVQFAVDSGTTSPGTSSGGATWARGAMDVRIAGQEHALTLRDCGGDVGRHLEIYENNQPVTIIPKTSRIDRYKMNPHSVVLGYASTDPSELPHLKVDDLQPRSGPSIQVPGLVGASGATFSNGLSLTGQTVNPGAIAAGSTVDVPFTMTGLGANDRVVAEPQGTGLESGLVWCVFCSAANQVTLRISNVTAGSITPASRSWNFTSWAVS